VEPGNLDETGSHLGGVQFILTDDPKRGISTQELAKAWLAETGPISGAQSVSFTGTIMGHPGKPIEIGIDGNDPHLLSQAEQDLKSKLGRIGGVFDVQSDLIPGKNELRFRLKPDATSLGITVQDIASQLYSGYYGDEVLRLQRGRNSVKIRVRYTEAERTRLSSLENVRIRTDQGEEIPLLQVVEVDAGPGFSTITRTDGHRRITVSADVDTAVIHANEVIAELQQGFFKELESRYPGIHLVLKGDAGETEESFDSLLIGFVLVMFAMYLLVATLFHSYLQPVLILITVPFGIIGAIWGHFLLGHDLTMISMFGMIGLTGVVLNDAIVLIEKINQNRLSGMPLLEAIREGGIRRFRAIFLTSITTIGGLFSLMIEADPYAFTLQPMAITIVAGITVTTVLTLFLIPVLLVMANDLNAGLRKLFVMPKS
jgi:multidrug efflux pump subunit AcrB